MVSYSVVLCIRHLMGQPLYCSAADGRCGEREAMVMAPPSMHDLAVLFQEGGPLPGPETGLLSNTQK